MDDSCDEAIYINSGGQWNAYWLKHNGTERCLRGHVTLRENRDVGLASGRFVQQQRVLDNDPYYVWPHA